MADQDPDLFEEFVIEEEETPSNRPFLLAAGGLIAIFVLALLCLGVYQIFFNGSEDPTAVADNGIAATATSISATNEAIETQNAFDTQTLAAMELTSQAPTATPTLAPTNTPQPSPTPTATATPVIQTEGEGEEPEATSVFEEEELTATPEEAGAGEGDDGSATSGDIAGSNANTGETLPQTGISVWGGLSAALGLLLIILVSRRLRTS